MKLLNFKHFMSSGKKTAEKIATRQEHKKEAREAKADKLKRHLAGQSRMPFLGSGVSDLLKKQPQVHTRQSIKMKLRTEAFDELTKKYSGESRRRRRAMASDLAKRRFQELREQGVK